MIIELNEKIFDENISKGLKLVEFYAPWCGYCVQQNLILEEMKEITTYRINGDITPSLTSKYNINSYPTFVVFKNGQAVNKFLGLHTKFELMKILMEHMNK